MKKTIYLLVMAVLCLNFKSTAQQFAELSGQVMSASGKPLAGATAKIKSATIIATTDKNGNFTITTSTSTGTLIISHIGYQTKEVPFDIKKARFINIILQESKNDLTEVSIVSTGYQNIPKERATGAFSSLNQKNINRNIGVNILDRMEGLTSGVLLNRNLQNGANNSKISVRGRSTLFGNADPLIVLDGFPYEATIEQINPADINTIDVLKDAAAASIWGTRASNGVIVITTKRGRNNQKTTIGVSTTLTIAEKPNLYYLPQMSSTDYIELEQYLFSKGYYNNSLSTQYSPISPVIEILNRRKKNQISSSDSATLINDLKSHDIRSELERYAYRPQVYQQYALNVSGGGQSDRFYLSGGYDKNLENKITNSYERFTLNANNAVSVLKDKLEISTDVGFAISNTGNKFNPYTPYTPYDRLASEFGNSLAVVNNLRLSYIDTAGNGKLLDWYYRPKDELSSDISAQLVQYRIKLGLTYKFSNALSLAASYQFLKENYQVSRNLGINSYYTRNRINTFTSINGNDLIRAIPFGDILNEDLSNLSSKTARLQVNYKKLFAKDHEINAIVGYENNDARSKLINQIYYGYNQDMLTNGNNTIDPQKYYPYYYSPTASAQIPTAPGLTGRINFSQSYYGNMSYTYKNRYILSGSARRDESNLFGVKTNQKGVPLWSAGLAWIVDQENFYHADWLSSLKIRATYGYNGNIDKTVSGFLTIQNYGLSNPWGSPYSTITNPPNSLLRWEKVKSWNLGIDYALKGNRITGSIDLYQKKAIDLIGNTPIAMQSGVTQFRGNGASLLTQGIDVILNSKNLVKNLQWNTTLLFNYNTDKVTEYEIKQSSNLDIVQNNYKNPLIGYPYYAIFSFASAGLDATGSPQGYLNNEISKDYTSILLSLNTNQLKYHGSASPKYFGSIINTFAYKGLELSLNIVYKLNYYFRRYTVFSGSSYSYTSLNYDKRWKKPGDELITRIPALSYPQTLSYGFFENSEDLVEPGDHIRLQDIRLSWNLTSEKLKRTPFKNAALFVYVKNLGIIWRKNKWNLDPDYTSTSIPQSPSYSLGINFTL